MPLVALCRHPHLLKVAFSSERREDPGFFLHKRTDVHGGEECTEERSFQEQVVRVPHTAVPFCTSFRMKVECSPSRGGGCSEVPRSGSSDAPRAGLSWAA